MDIRQTAIQECMCYSPIITSPWPEIDHFIISSYIEITPHFILVKLFLRTLKMFIYLEKLVSIFNYKRKNNYSQKHLFSYFKKVNNKRLPATASLNG